MGYLQCPSRKFWGFEGFVASQSGGQIIGLGLMFIQGQRARCILNVSSHSWLWGAWGGGAMKSSISDAARNGMLQIRLY